MDVPTNQLPEQTYDRSAALKVVRDYRCSQCWGPLVSQPVVGTNDAVVACPTCGNDRGMVRAEYVKRRVQRAKEDAAEARYNLRGILPCLSTGQKTEAEILKQLGF